MIIYILLALTFLIGVISFVAHKKLPVKKNSWGDFPSWWQITEKIPTIAAGVFGVFLLCGMLFSFDINNKQIVAKNKLTKIERERENLIRYRKDIEGNIKSSLAKYPGIESDQLDKIDPIILVNYPKLRSSETLTQEFKALSKVDKQLLANKQDTVDTLNDIQNRKDSIYNKGLLFID